MNFSLSKELDEQLSELTHTTLPSDDVDLSLLDPGVVDLIDFIQNEFKGDIKTLQSCEGHVGEKTNSFPLNLQVKVNDRGLVMLFDAFNRLNDKARSTRSERPDVKMGFWRLQTQNSSTYDYFPKWDLVLYNAANLTAIEIGRDHLFEAFNEVRSKY